MVCSLVFHQLKQRDLNWLHQQWNITQLSKKTLIRSNLTHLYDYNELNGGSLIDFPFGKATGAAAD